MTAPTPESQPSQQVLDCRAVVASLPAVAEPSSLHVDDYPRDIAERYIEISDAAARLADALVE